ncbi:MAG: hypothetical protein WBX38_07300 [Candidatus Sulfotelmatobacter sp.]
MKKQASDQQFHDRRHQERKRAEASKKPLVKKTSAGTKETSAAKATGTSEEKA